MTKESGSGWGLTVAILVLLAVVVFGLFVGICGRNC
jgi:hypothetical protein